MGCTLIFDPVPCLFFITVFEFVTTFWVWLVNSFQKARVETSLFQDYILDSTLDNETPNGDNDINDNYDDDDYDHENYVNDNNGNSDCNHHDDYNDDDNDNNYDNANGNQAIMIFQAIHFGESFACEKTEFCESAQILMCLHSVNPSLIYRGGLRFLKNHRNESSRSLCQIHGEREEIHVGG